MADFSGSSATFSAAGVNTLMGPLQKLALAGQSAVVRNGVLRLTGRRNWNMTTWILAPLTGILRLRMSVTGAVTTPARSATSYMNIVKLGVAYRF